MTTDNSGNDSGTILPKQRYNLINKKVESLLQVAQQGNVDAMYKLALTYHELDNAKSAIRQEQQSKGKMTIITNEGVRTAFVDYSTVNLEKAVECFTKAAEAGNVDAMIKLGYGYGTSKYNQARSPHGDRFETSIYWYEKAAELGSALAMFNLGCTYCDEDYAGKNDDESFKWFLMASKKGHSNANEIVATCYFEGSGVEQDYQKAINYLPPEILTEEYYNEHKRFIIDLVPDVEEVRNLSDVITILKLRCDKGDANATYCLGEIFRHDFYIPCKHDFYIPCNSSETGWRPYTISKKEGCRLLQFAAENGHVKAMLKLSRLDTFSTKKEISQEEAMSWFKKAAESGNPEALYKYGEHKLYRGSSENDANEAFQCIYKSAVAGHQPAVEMLVGKDNSFDPTLDVDVAAFNWFQRLVNDTNRTDMRCMLAICYRNGRGVEKDILRAMHCVDDYMFKNPCPSYMGGLCADVAYWMGTCYETGNVVARDNKRAIEFYEYAANLGTYESAKAMLKVAKYYEDTADPSLTTYRPRIQCANDWYSKAAKLDPAMNRRQVSFQTASQGCFSMLLLFAGISFCLIYTLYHFCF